MTCVDAVRKRGLPWRSLGAAAAIIVGGGAVLGYTVRSVQSRARGDIEDYRSHAAGDLRPVVVAGASIVRGRASVDFVDMLRQRFPAHPFVNAGVNGNVAWELVQRLDQVLQCRPDVTILLIGTNDVQATLSDAAAASTQEAKSLPSKPSVQWYAECMGQVVHRLQVADSRVAVCSLPLIGQDLSDDVNERVRAFNAALADLCEQTDATYLPVGEAMAAYLKAHGATDGPRWTGSWAPGLASLVRHFVLGHSYDRISRSQGWLLSPDGVHLNSVGADIAASVVGDWLATVWRGAQD